MDPEAPPGTPLMVFDGECGFCRIWIGYWKRLTGEQVAYAPYQEVADRFPKIPRESFQRAVQLILPDGEVLSAAHAVFRTLAQVEQRRWALWAYHHVPGFAVICEMLYRWIAAHRSFSYRVTVLLWGKHVEPATYDVVNRWFLRAIGAIYLIAFLSLAVQITGLVGARGILPAGAFLGAVRENLGSGAWLRVPTVFWLGAGNLALRLVCFAGALASLAAIAGVLRRHAGSGVCPVSFAGPYRPDVSLLSMGLSAARSGLPRDFSDSFVGTRFFVPLAAVSTDVAVRKREALKRRSDLAKPDGASIPLPHATAADSLRLVLRAIAGGIPEGFGCFDVLRRAGNAVSDVRAAPCAVLRSGNHHHTRGLDLLHRQLYVFQPARDRPLSDVVR